jgi:phosphoribosyl 1,2-cyclic phosphodiesterase
VKVWVLGSGSSGNAVLLESDGLRILVDAGFGPRTLRARLKLAGVDPNSIIACILTHDHSDHVSGAAKAVRRWGWPLFATAGTAAGLDVGDALLTTFPAGATLRFGTLEIETFATPHDAAEPIGVAVSSLTTGYRAGICYDIGHASANVRALCRDVDLLVLEANHDEGMLWAGPYPPWLCQRIAGDTGHLSNRAAGQLVRDTVTRRLGHLVLAHLSAHNNTETIATRTVRSALRGTAFRGTLSAASQREVVGPFMPRGVKHDSPLQYALGI